MRPDSPWDGLPVPPPGNLEARRADATHPCNFFYARNAQGDFMLTLQVSCVVPGAEGLPRLRGVDVLSQPLQGRLQLRLCASSDRDMFAVLCRDLLACSHTSRSDDECVERLLTRLSRWQRLLSRGRSRRLNEEQIRGLVAELLFLRDEVLPRLGPAAVAAWKGPQGYPQDFAIDGLAIEVKSHLVGAPAVVRISSPEQLSAEGAVLYLRVQRLAEVSAEGLDLVSLVREIAALLEDQPAELASFELTLSEAGYHEVPEYSGYRLSPEGVATYLVSGAFPRVVPQDVPNGVCNLAYSVKLPVLEPYRAEIGWQVQDGQDAR